MGCRNKSRNAQGLKVQSQGKTAAKFPRRRCSGACYRDRDHFISSIRDDEVCRLASAHHHSDACEFFEPPVRGSYNICYFVQFHQGDKWVVRVPLAPADKLESEVAVMQ
jgi:hypothetical protein